MARLRKPRIAILPRRRALAATGLLLATCAAALLLVVRAHAAALPAVDSFDLELVAGMLGFNILVLLIAGWRVVGTQRRFERRRIGKKLVEDAVEDFGGLWAEQRVRYRMETLVRDGAIAAQDQLVRVLVTSHPGYLVLADGQGVVVAASAEARKRGLLDLQAPLATEPPIHRVIDDMLNGADHRRVDLRGQAVHAQGIRAPIHLGSRTKADLTDTDLNDGLAYIIVSDQPLSERPEVTWRQRISGIWGRL